MKVSLFISIHPDDIPFSLGTYIQSVENAIVVSPFCGIPIDDPKGKFKHLLLNKEHHEACEVLNVKEINGDFFDDVYHDTRDISGLKDWFGKILNDYSDNEIYVPLGIHHPDHILVRDIFMQHFKIDYYYAELPYRIRWDYMAENLRMLLCKNRTLITTPSNAKKEEAVRKYVSQTDEEVINDILVEEHIWR